MTDLRIQQAFADIRTSLAAGATQDEESAQTKLDLRARLREFDADQPPEITYLIQRLDLIEDDVASNRAANRRLIEALVGLIEVVARRAA